MSKTLNSESDQQNKKVYIENMSSFYAEKLINHNEFNIRQQCCKMWCWKLFLYCDIHAAIESKKEYRNNKICI